MCRSGVGVREFCEDLRPIIHFQDEGFIMQTFHALGNSSALNGISTKISLVSIDPEHTILSPIANINCDVEKSL